MRTIQIRTHIVVPLKSRAASKSSPVRAAAAPRTGEHGEADGGEVVTFDRRV
jgi:hypothetical protein